jgi:hypothetical protein
VADGTVFEMREMPAAALVTHSFQRAADSMARRRGFEGYRYVVLPHPVSSLSPEQVRERAEEALPQVLELLGITEARGVPAK